MIRHSPAIVMTKGMFAFRPATGQFGWPVGKRWSNGQGEGLHQQHNLSGLDQKYSKSKEREREMEYYVTKG